MRPLAQPEALRICSSVLPRAGAKVQYGPSCARPQRRRPRASSSQHQPVPIQRPWAGPAPSFKINLTVELPAAKIARLTIDPLVFTVHGPVGPQNLGSPPVHQRGNRNDRIFVPHTDRASTSFARAAPTTGSLRTDLRRSGENDAEVR